MPRPPRPRPTGHARSRFSGHALHPFGPASAGLPPGALCTGFSALPALASVRRRKCSRPAAAGGPRFRAGRGRCGAAPVPQILLSCLPASSSQPRGWTQETLLVTALLASAAAQARTPSCSCRPCRPCGPRGSDSSSRKKPGGGLLPWTTPWPGFWTCWRAAGAGGERAPPWRPGSPTSCSAGYGHSHALAQPSPRLEQLQARAVRVLTESPSSLAAPLASIFQLQDADQSCLLEHVHRLYHEGRFREAVMLGTKLKLQPELDVEKMSIPLLLQDKVALVERYVAGFPDLQRRLLALMDSWCQPGFDIKDVVRQHPQVASVRLEKLSPQVLSRQVLRLQEQFSVIPALCPHAAMQQRLAALRHLCHKRFVEKSLSQENWADHVQGLVGQSPWLQEQLSQLLASLSDPSMAAQCTLNLPLPEDRLLATVAAGLGQLQLQGRAAEAVSRLNMKDVKDHYYQLPIPRENIYLLTSQEDLARHKDALLQPQQVVGVDLEWTLVFIAGGRPRPSLLQVATEGCVFLLDILAFTQPPAGQGAQAFSQLVAQLLSDPSITKLGYGMAGDLQKLGMSCPILAHVEKQVLGGVDLLLVHRQVQYLQPATPTWSLSLAVSAPSPSLCCTGHWQRGQGLLLSHREAGMRMAGMPTPGMARAGGLRGLSLLVQQVLGTTLDKTQQLSNWDRRPLFEEQLIYAAADAYCLLEVHQALCREPARFHLSGDLAGSQRPRHRERPGTQEPPGLQEALAAPRQVPLAVAEATIPQVPARTFRVVCDNMLQGLARSLRCLGVDVHVLDNSEDHRRAAEVARLEGRIILTSGQPYHTVSTPRMSPRGLNLIFPSSQPLGHPTSGLACHGLDPGTSAIPLMGRERAPAPCWRRQAGSGQVPGSVLPLSSLAEPLQLRAQVGAGRCLMVDGSLKAQQQAKAVLRHFNVRVTHADIFSRCQACNCDQYLKVSRDTMKQLMRLSGHQEGPRTSGDKSTQSQESQEPGPAPEEAPGGCTHDRPCRWLQAADLCAETPDMLANGTRLQLARVPAGVLRTLGLWHFYCCTRCGKVFWDGSHLGRVATHFRDILESAPGPCELSPAPSPASSFF
uniref:exonuclease mut-7 homolog isoform X6 n=1 Tax=Callithrix jacchus TaxID=9483 RepID=UPI0023DD4A05|nr:exonuclease mut-7 homolog isoform X6 [Callithrix jacchus]